MKTIKIAIANQKGGVTKTTTAIEISSALAKKKKKVLLIDLDPQGQTASGLSVPKDEDTLTLGNLISNSKINVETVIQETYIPNLHIIPSNKTLKVAIKLLEATPAGKGGGAVVTLRNKIKPIEDRYDFIIIDTPPEFDILTMSGLALAEYIITPMMLGKFEAEGAYELVEMINTCNKNINTYIQHNATLFGVLITLYNPRAKLFKKKMREIEAVFGDLIFQTKIPPNIRVMEAQDEGMSVQDYDSKCKAAIAYKSLAQEIILKGAK